MLLRPYSSNGDEYRTLYGMMEEDKHPLIRREGLLQARRAETREEDVVW
jgi:hypothetical protein